MSNALLILQSAAGFYLGTLDQDGLPNSRESEEYWRTAADAAAALQSGQWTPRANQAETAALALLLNLLDTCQ